MFDFHSYPWTNFHGINLNWILNEIKRLDGDVDKIKEWIAGADIPETVRAVLQEMLDDGTLADIINEELLGEINTRTLLTMHGYSYDEERKARYQNAVLNNVASFLARNSGGTYFASGAPLTNPRCVVKYSSANSWQAYRWLSTPIYTDTETVNGNTCKVIYCDCSSFTALITANKSFETSPYGVAFANGTETAIRLAGLATPVLGNDYAYDFNGLENTDQMSIQLRANGYIPIFLARNINGTLSIYQDGTDLLETGDILFSGSGAADKNLYELTGHCLVYIKTLQELNNCEFCRTNNITFKAYDDGDPQYGFVAEVAYSTSSGNDYTNCLRIGTLDNHMRRSLSAYQNITYGYKASANGMNSNVISHFFKGLYRDYNKLYFVPIHYENPLNAPISMNMAQGTLDLTSISRYGIQIPKDTDVNTLTTSGQYRCTYGENLPTITSIPHNRNFFLLDVDGLTISGTFYGRQTFRILSDKYPAVYVRSCLADVWSPWEKVLTKHSGSDTFGEVGANTYANLVVNFAEMDHIPAVIATPRFAATVPTTSASKITVGIYAKTSSSVTLRCYNGSDEPTTVGVDWFAL